jgi:hypothetical protein
MAETAEPVSGHAGEAEWRWRKRLNTAAVMEEAAEHAMEEADDHDSRDGRRAEDGSCDEEAEHASGGGRGVRTRQWAWRKQTPAGMPLRQNTPVGMVERLNTPAGMA